MPTTENPTFTLPSFDKLPTFEQLKSALPVDTDRLISILRDAAYVVIGFGVLTVQQIQSRARDLVAAVESNPTIKQMGFDKAQLEELVAKFEAQIVALDERFESLEARLDTVVEKVEDRLPKQAAEALGQAHDIAKAARKQVRGLLRSA